MRGKSIWTAICVLFLTGTALAAESGELKLASLFTDNMVLQQGRKIPVWGTAPDGARILVELNGKKAEAETSNGKWMVKLPSMKQGGPYTMKVSSGNREVELKNVLLGEVWIASGQSNMEFGLSGADNATAEAAAAKYPNIRFFTVERTTSPKPLDSVRGSWVECNPKNAPAFSAVAYFFARKLATEDGLNVGIIHTSWGGTPAEAWTDEETIKSDPEFASLLGPLEGFKNSSNLGKQEIERKMAEWEKFWDDTFARNDELGMGWADPAADLSGWTKTELPKDGSILSGIDGVVWYRRDVVIPEAWAGKDLVLKLGPIDDFDISYFNGLEVGRIYKDTPNWYMTPREYTVPAALVRPGRNTVAVRVIDNWLGGGFGGGPDAMQIQIKDGSADQSVALAGPWVYKTAFQFDSKRDPGRPEQGSESQVASMLYNAMISPLIPYGIQGAIWYQGESNASRFMQYRKLFPAMIECWRRAWGEGAFPFYFVQLANYMQRLDAPAESEWAGLREAQSMTLKLKNTGMAVIIDIGDAGNIHPTNKQDVGKRLALWAQAKVYGKRDIEYSGPLYRKMKIDGGRAVVSFDHAKGGLTVKGGGKVEGFAVAGADGKFVWANAEIVGDKVIVSSPLVGEPRAVRYGWADNPAVSLTNRAGLPASPFRTDMPK
jgi:sialate O-acetylesterase